MDRFITILFFAVVVWMFFKTHKGGHDGDNDDDWEPCITPPPYGKSEHVEYSIEREEKELVVSGTHRY